MESRVQEGRRVYLESLMSVSRSWRLDSRSGEYLMMLSGGQACWMCGGRQARAIFSATGWQCVAGVWYTFSSIAIIALHLYFAKRTIISSLLVNSIVAVRNYRSDLERYDIVLRWPLNVRCSIALFASDF